MSELSLAESIKSSTKSSSTSPPDGGYGWVIVIACGVAIGFVSSVIKCAGLVYVAVLAVHPETDRMMAITMTTAVRGVMFLVGILSVNFCEIYSYRVVVFVGGIVGALGLILCSAVNNVILLIFLFGGITGLGTGFVHAPCIAITASYFTTRRSTAVGLMLTLSGLIICFFPPLLQWLMDEYGLNGMLLLWGGVMFHVCAVSLLLRQPDWDGEGDVLLKKKKKMNVFSVITTLFKKLGKDLFLFKHCSFLLLLGNRVSFFFNNVAVPVIVPDYIQTDSSRRVDMNITALMVTLIAAGDLVARLVSGWVLDYFAKWRKHIYLIALTITAWSTLAFQWITDYIILIAVNCGVYGFLCGIDLILTYVLIFDVFPADGTGGHAIQQTVTGLSLFLEGPVLGSLWNARGSYDGCWNILAIIVFISVALWIVEVPCFKRLRNKTP